MLVADQLAHLEAGTEGQVRTLHDGLAKIGWRVELAVLRNSIAIEDRWEGPVRELGIRSLANPLSWWRAMRFASQVRKERFDVVHIFFNDASIILPPILRMWGLKVIVSRRDMGIWYTRWNLPVLRLVRFFVSCVVANSHAVGRLVSAKEGYSDSTVRVIYNGIDLVENEPLPQPSETAAPVIGLVANIRPVKRISDAIAAMKQVTNSHPTAVLEVLGGGDAAPLARQAVDLEIENHVKFAGRVADISSRIANYTICILTSESEGLSNALVEYQAAGRPIVCSDTGGNPEIVEHGESGFLYPVGDSDTLARHLSRLLSDPELRTHLASNARNNCERRFSIEDMLSKYMRLYHEVAGNSFLSSGSVRGAT